MTAPEVGAVVVGGGIAGLAAAVELQQSVRDVLVLDPEDRPGGVMRTDHVGGYVVERGPNTFQVKPPMLGALRRDGLDSALRRAAPSSRLRSIYHDGRLVRVPMSPSGLAGTPLLSAGGKLRLLTEPFRRRGDAASESVAEFVGRRLGPEVARNLVGPFLTGVYAGDEDELGAEAVFGSLVDHERRAGSIAAGLVRGLFRRRGSKGLRGIHSAVEGLGPFARALAALLVEPPALGNRVSGVRREGTGWLVSVSGNGGESRLRTRRLVVAAPSRDAAEILRAVSPAAAEELEGIDYAPIVGVAIGVQQGDALGTIEGFGFLVARDAGIRLLGCLFMSQLFPGRAPAGHELLQCMIGGRRWPEAVELPDDVLAEQVRCDLDRVLGLHGDPNVLGVTRWPRAVCQPARGHMARLGRIRGHLSDQSGLALAGSYLGGVGVPDTFASGLAAARQVLATAPPG
ncbi:MAG: protoporphyrinogen oxidase [Myxococcota bacterium]